MAEPEGWRELLPVAYLLTGSDTAARDLLARGLSRGGGLPGLVRAHLRRRFGGDGAIRGTSGAPWWVSPEDAAAAARLATALDTLTRPERTAVVLRWYAGLPVEQVPGVDPDAAVARLAGEVPDPADLPDRLEGLAGLADVSSLTDDDIELGVRAVRSRRRSRVVLAVGVLAVLAVGAAVLPDALPRTPPQAAATSSAASTVAVGPARGSLAQDEEFLDEARAALDPPWQPGEGQVGYAGDSGGVRWVLLVDASARGMRVAWATGPAGSPAAELSTSTGVYSGSSVPDAWAATAAADGASVLLVVARPGDDLEVSAALDVAADGTTSRDFQPAATEDGVATVPLDRPAGTGAQFRLVRDDIVLPVDRPWFTGPWGEPLDGVLLDARSGVVLDPTVVRDAVSQITYPTGYPEGDLDVTVLGAGSFAAPGGDPASAVTVAAVLPSGAVATATSWVVDAGDSGTGGSCGTGTYPAGTDVASLTVVARCASYAGDGSTFGATVLVSAPPGVVVQLNTAAGGSPQTPALVDGWGYVIDVADELTGFSADGVLGTVSREGAGPFDDY